jgi:ATP-dependent DNA ligase
MYDKFTSKYIFSQNDDLFFVLDKLINREITGHDALNYIIDLIKFLGDKYRQIIFDIVNKDLRANVNAAIINKIAIGTVKEFKVALAERKDEAPIVHTIDESFEGEDKSRWMISRKLDGVRTIAFLEANEPKFYSRTGSVFTTLTKLSTSVKKILQEAKSKYGEEFVLDGECCIIDKDGKDDFASVMKEITRKNHEMSNPKYVIFDFIKKSEFDNANGNTPFGTRMKMLENLHIEAFGTDVMLIQRENSISKENYKK